MESYEKSVKEGALTPFTYQRLCCLHLEAGRLPQALGSAQQGIKVLKKARTNLPQEIYFWFVFQRLKRKIIRRIPFPTAWPEVDPGTSACLTASASNTGPPFTFSSSYGKYATILRKGWIESHNPYEIHPPTGMRHREGRY